MKSNRDYKLNVRSLPCDWIERNRWKDVGTILTFIVCENFICIFFFSFFFLNACYDMLQETFATTDILLKSALKP